MTTPPSGRTFSRDLQRAFLVHLPGWKKHGMSGLYRRTPDFVQFLVFGSSAYEVLRVPACFIQALAVQFPGIGSNTSWRIQKPGNGDLWLSPDDWHRSPNTILNIVLQQIKPSALEPLTTHAIAQAVRPWIKTQDPHILTTLGLLAIADERIEEGRDLLRQAIAKYRVLTVDWAKDAEQRITIWLTIPTEQILTVLRQDAEQGAAILRLK